MAQKNEHDINSHLINHPVIQINEQDIIMTGWLEITAFLNQQIDQTSENNGKSWIIGIDGYPGTDWPMIMNSLKDNFLEHRIRCSLWNVEACRLTERELDSLLQPYLGNDPVFGRIYKKGLTSLFDPSKLATLKAEITSEKSEIKDNPGHVILCYGTGALLKPLRSLYDVEIYCDLTREETLKRNKQWAGLSGKTQSISPKKLYYVDMQINDAHRNNLLNRIDLYIDGNDPQEPRLLSTQTLQKVSLALATGPIRLKYMYEPGPWGGQWLKKVRNLPSDWVNCAWSYEVIATEMSMLANIQNTMLELPWTTFFHLQYKNVMGRVPRRRFRGEFPIRFDYLDTMDGGDLSIQAHPTTAYIRDNFGETYHQGEMYYIVDAKVGAAAKLGLREDTDLNDFRQAAVLADEAGIPFDGDLYVNRVPCKKHDLLMIPPGTVHGSGEGLVVLEISATTYRYTFKIYDYLRPDLNGVMRPIHIDHAFNVIKPFRRTRWVAENLIQHPALIREGAGWAEYRIGDRREFFHVVSRLEFENQVNDDTNGKFHLLTLVEGDSVVLNAVEDERKTINIHYSETVIIPANFGKYRMTNEGERLCKVVKARLR